MTRIIVNDRYAIGADSTCWYIEELITPSETAKKTEPYWKQIKWFGNVTQASLEMIDLQLRCSGAESFKELLEELHTLREDMKRLLK